MPLVCAGTQLLRKASTRSDIQICDEFCRAVDGAFDATTAVDDGPKLQRLSAKECRTIRGEDTSTLVVLQREVGCVAPGDQNVAAQNRIQYRACSIDATTCLILAVRDPYSGTTVVAHFDSGADEQVDDGMTLALNYLPAKPLTTYGLLSTAQRNDVEELQAKYKAKRVVQVYLLGAVKHPKFSSETLSGVLRYLSDDADVVYNVVLDGVCVWTHNYNAEKKNLFHRGLLVESHTGACWPVQCDRKRAYPAGRLRGLRCFDSSVKLSGVTLLPGETVAAASSVDEPGKRRGLQYVLIVRPFTYPAFGLTNSRKPVSSFMNMSTSPDYESEDFGEVIKASVVYGSLSASTSVFPPNPRNPQHPSPVAFQLALATTTGPATEADAQQVGTSDGPSRVEEVADEASRQLQFEWVQISPAQATPSTTAPSS